MSRLRLRRVSIEEIPIMAKKCLCFLLVSALLQMPALARADSPDEIEKLKKQLENSQKELKKLQEERDGLLKEKEKRDGILKELILDPELRKKLGLPPESLNEKLNRLMNQYEKLLKENNRLPRGQKMGSPPRPSPDAVVTSVADNLATISIGSDSGLKLGQVLQVYRLEPDPEYLGTLKITNIEAHKAAGKFNPATGRAVIKKGDKVTAKVLDEK